MDSGIRVEGVDRPLDDGKVHSLVGAVVCTLVGGPLPLGGAHLLDLLWFARVIKIRRRRGGVRRCPHCTTRPARFAIEVEWEAGYQSPGGSILCEACVFGVVTAGNEHVGFGAAGPRSPDAGINMTFDLREVAPQRAPLDSAEALAIAARAAKRYLRALRTLAK